MKVYLIGDSIDAKTGLRLVGVEGSDEIRTEAELLAELEKVRLDREIGIVVITEKFAFAHAAAIENFKLHNRRPLIALIPDRDGTARRGDFLSRYVREAIGVKIGG